MNKILIIASMMLVLAGVLITTGGGTGHSALACPSTGTGTSVPNANQTTTTGVQLPSQPTTGQIV